ncbi:hypothetical protein ACFLRC_01550, partial [Candidatus Altiarchaeota archaeon]
DALEKIGDKKMRKIWLSKLSEKQRDEIRNKVLSDWSMRDVVGMSIRKKDDFVMKEYFAEGLTNETRWGRAGGLKLDSGVKEELMKDEGMKDALEGGGKPAKAKTQRKEKEPKEKREKATQTPSETAPGPEEQPQPTVEQGPMPPPQQSKRGPSFLDKASADIAKNKQKEQEEVRDDSAAIREHERDMKSKQEEEEEITDHTREKKSEDQTSDEKKEEKKREAREEE